MTNKTSILISNLRRLILASVALLSLQVMAGGEVIKKSFDVNAGEELRVATDVGSIEIETHSRSTVKVHVEIEGFDSDDFSVDMDYNSGVMKIDGKRNSRGWSRGGKRKVHFFVTIPERFNVDLSTRGGSIRVQDLEGEVQADTSGGSLKFGNIKGDINGRTSGGSISVGDVEGNVKVKTSGGSLRIGRIDGNIRGRTSGGSISLDGVAGKADVATSGGSIRIDSVGRSISAKTSGGSIKAVFEKQPDGDSELSTSGGSITVTLPDDAALDIDARGSKVVSDFSIGGVKKAKRKLKGSINGGGPELELHTSAGSVYIKRD
ncbi:DUF4097 domain-containing protein [Pleionea sp. CnH1-48]|uniref:DUF4097 family beta strand repeat-containing protein n=1 Tax=Pleionea sp. CnH1-48 TaxID=2954494 RepID=UPI00209812B7|nr:DUF4097 domain-containing protein [Pleionea sp. CnH1-48]MCO7224427.1 DUF4097 domain-containing protein [Pleionea sp. CnH1-48]